jgi:hypothetical protein
LDAGSGETESGKIRQTASANSLVDDEPANTGDNLQTASAQSSAEPAAYENRPQFQVVASWSDADEACSAPG